jgi:hypothetical protein
MALHMRAKRFVKYGCVIGTIRNEDIAQKLDMLHDYVGL